MRKIIAVIAASVFMFLATSLISSQNSRASVRATTSGYEIAKIDKAITPATVYVTVPNVIGLWQERAFDRLHRHGLRAVGTRVVRGRILIVRAQRPFAGSHVPKGTLVRLTSRLLPIPLPESLGNRMLDWAETQKGKPYEWGGTGPGGYDCSGLVYAAAIHIGINLPRTTYEMLAGSTHLYFISLSSARRGDLLFYGSGHVEFDTVFHDTSFGAHDSALPIGWIKWGWGWAPTMAMRIR